MAKGARAAGAAIARFTKVTAITRSAGGEWVVETDKGQVTCEILVNAAGFWGAEVARMAGDAIPVATLQPTSIW